MPWTLVSAQSLDDALEAGKKSRGNAPPVILEAPSPNIVGPDDDGDAAGSVIKKQDEERALRSLNRAIDERNAQAIRELGDRLPQ